MDNKITIKMENGQYKVPVSEELYNMNLEYFRGMGIYDELTCQEKALTITGFRIVQKKEQDCGL